MSEQTEGTNQEAQQKNLPLPYIAILTALDKEAVDAPNEDIDANIEQLPLKDALQLLKYLTESIDQIHIDKSTLQTETRQFHQSSPNAFLNAQLSSNLISRLMRYIELRNKTMQRCQVAEREMQAKIEQLTEELRKYTQDAAKIPQISDGMTTLCRTTLYRRRLSIP